MVGQGPDLGIIPGSQPPCQAPLATPEIPITGKPALAAELAWPGPPSRSRGGWRRSEEAAQPGLMQEEGSYADLGLGCRQVFGLGLWGPMGTGVA